MIKVNQFISRQQLNVSEPETGACDGENIFRLLFKKIKTKRLGSKAKVNASGVGALYLALSIQTTKPAEGDVFPFLPPCCGLSWMRAHGCKGGLGVLHI